MPTPYMIFIVNQSSDDQLFWAFLAPPVVTNDPRVFANSNTVLSVPGLSTDLNSIQIPVQYVIGAGASNNAVGLNTVITSSATRNTNLQVLWDVNYAATPPLQGPIVPLSSSGESPARTVAMKTNKYPKELNIENGWYENMSFGVKTAQGFMGVTWSPQPNKTYTITPKLTFYITVGNYSSYSLADIDSVSNDCVALDTSQDFSLNNVCTVVYTNDGGWSHFKGRPSAELLSVAWTKALEYLPPGESVALLQASLPNGQGTNSKTKVNGVTVKGVRGVTYSTTSNVTVNCDDQYEYIIMTDQTDQTVKFGKGVYKVTNNSGGTINYEWVS